MNPYAMVNAAWQHRLVGKMLYVLMVTQFTGLVGVPESYSAHVAAPIATMAVAILRAVAMKTEHF